MKLSPDTAAICGLFCGTCPSYPTLCKGCLSDQVAPGCDVCPNGFRTCAVEHKVTRCFECSEFPCPRLEHFSKQHYINGIGHHVHVMDDLRQMGEIGVPNWVDAQTDAHTCKTCGRLIPWFQTDCPSCKK